MSYSVKEPHTRRRSARGDLAAAIDEHVSTFDPLRAQLCKPWSSCTAQGGGPLALSASWPDVAERFTRTQHTSLA
jgi:hypothetical protein